MSLRKSFLVVACSLLNSLPTMADVIVMKNGDRLNAVVLRKERDNYVVEVKVSATIRDERIISQADVERIEKETKDLKAFTAIADFIPSPELLDQEGYEERIELIEDFIQQYPRSPKAAIAKKMAEELNAELALITEGGIRFGEGIVLAADYEANAFSYDVRVAEKKIKDTISRRDLLSALRKFDEYERSFGVQEGGSDLAALMLKVLGSYQNELRDSLASFDTRIKAREVGLSRMSLEDKARSERALKDEEAEITKRLQDEKAAKTKWTTPHIFHKESLAEAERQVVSEITRLGKSPEAGKIKLEELYRSAWKALSKGTEEAKKAVLDDAKAKLLPCSNSERTIL
jgi:hypothetical protein